MADMVVGMLMQKMEEINYEVPKVLSELKPLLKDADERARDGQDQTLCSLVYEITHAAYVLFDFFVSKNFFFRTQEMISEREQMTFEGLLSRLSALKSELERYGIQRNSVGDEVWRKLMERRLSESGADVVDELVGLEDDIKNLVDVLKSGRDVWICGMGGSGKTALARHIFHHPILRRHFDHFIWLHVPQHDEFKLEKEIDYLFMRREEKPQQLYQNLILDVDQLSQGTFLIVLDDVPTRGNLMRFYKAQLLRKRHPKCVLLLTSRFNNTFEYNCFVHKVKCLDETKSWELFQKKANFYKDTTKEDYDEMKEVAEMMVDHCAGLPLAITIVGKLLFNKGSLSDWNLLHNNIMAYLRGAPVHHNKDMSEYSYILWCLGLSYNELTYFSKACFLQLAQFSNRSTINPKHIFDMWSAESFSEITSSRFWEFNKNELVVNNMIEEKEMFYSGRREIKVSMHNLMWEVCLLKAREENFVQIINCGHTHGEIDSSSSGASFKAPVRRISINLSNDVDHHLLPLIKGMDGHVNLRSLICYNTSPYPSYERVMKEILGRFHMLRVLKFENFGTSGYVGKLPEEIGELINLRILSLRGTYVEHLPSSIGNLKWLEVLDLRTNWVLQLPNVLWKLEKLVHLYLPQRCYVKGSKLRFCDSTRLVTLVNIPMKYCDFNDLNDILRKVEKLKMSFHGKMWQDLNECAIDCRNLRSLALENLDTAEVDIGSFESQSYDLEKLHVEGKISDLRIGITLFVRLTKLRLSRSGLKQDPMPILGELRNLRSLYLDHGAFIGNKMVCSFDGFRRLETLSLVGLEQLKEWTMERWSLFSLKCLVIEYCYRLEAIPDGLKWVSRLEKLVIKRMPIVFQMRVQEGGYDFFKVQRVTNIQVLD